MKRIFIAVLAASAIFAPGLAIAQIAISGLPSATTPLAGTEVLPIVQGGVTKKVPASALGTAASAANPTATIGASAVNGAASTFMRSDAAPQLPATLPALSGVNLTSLNATNLGSGTVPAARMPALTGDVTTSAGAVATTLATVNSNVGTCGDSTHVGQANFDAKGRAISCTAVVIAAGGSGTVSSIAAGNGILLSTSPCVATCTISTTVGISSQATGHALIASEAGNIIYSNSGSAVAYSIAQASTSGFTSGAGWEVASVGAGATTITAATSTFGNGLTTLVLDKGQYAFFASDSTNYPITALSLPVVPSDGVMGNFTGSTNYPKWAVIPTCSTGSSALTYNTGTHAFGCNSIAGSGTVNSGTSGQLAYYASSSAAVSGANAGTGVITALGNALSSAGGVTSTISAGTSALGTSAIASGACATVVTTTATNVATTDTLLASFNGDPTAVTGYAPLSSGMLTIISYPSSGNVNFKVCNNTGGSITPGAITLNWRVLR